MDMQTKVEIIFVSVSSDFLHFNFFTPPCAVVFIIKVLPEPPLALRSIHEIQRIRTRSSFAKNGVKANTT